MMESFLKTDRLILKKLAADDVDNLYAIDSDPEVMKYIGAIKSYEEVKKGIQKSMASYGKTSGLGYWTALANTGNSFIGWCCLKNLDNTKDIEVGYRLMKKHWGNGFATEAAIRLINYGFRELGLKRIVGITHPENLASQKVLEKAGLKFQREAYYYNTDVFYYTIKNPALK